MKNIITYVAMDTHKKQHKIAYQQPDQMEIIECNVLNTARDLQKMVKKILRQAPGPVHFCYEAGVCGFTLKRRIEEWGGRCLVIAPSLVPRKPGERVKTDRRDAKKLLELFQAGLLTEVQAPQEAQEAARELTRLRETAQENLKRIRHQILKFLTRHGYLGLTPAEDSSGERQRKGAIISVGSARPRRVIHEYQTDSLSKPPTPQRLEKNKKLLSKK